MMKTTPASPSEWLKVIHAIAVEAMTAQSDPNAEAQHYRKALIGICNMALKAQDVLAEVSSPAMPQLEWRCFHCDEVFTDALEATQHFGSEEFKTPACRMSSDDVKRLRDLEDENAALRHENDRLDNDARLWHESEADRVRRIGNVQWWQEMDSREGEKLVLQEQLAVARAASPAASPFEVSEDARAHIAGVARRLRVIGDRDTPEGRGLQNLAGILTEALKGAASPATPAKEGDRCE